MVVGILLCVYYVLDVYYVYIVYMMYVVHMYSILAVFDKLCVLYSLYCTCMHVSMLYACEHNVHVCIRAKRTVDTCNLDRTSCCRLYPGILLTTVC
jgi:hypothetical protein